MPKNAHELEIEVDPWQHLPKAEMQAIEMKYEGKSYREIAEELDITYDTIAEWFRTVGKLRDVYISYAAQQNELIRSEATQELKGLLKKAVRRIGKLVESKNEKVALNAAQEVLDRELGKPTQPIVTDDSREIDDLANDVRELLDQFDIQNGYHPFEANPNGDTATEPERTDSGDTADIIDT